MAHTAGTRMDEDPVSLFNPRLQDLQGGQGRQRGSCSLFKRCICRHFRKMAFRGCHKLGIASAVTREVDHAMVNIKKGPTGGIFVANGYHEPIKRSLNNLINSGDVTIEHLFQARLLIEPHIAKEAAQNATAADLKKLQTLFEDAERHLDNPIHLKQSNLNFHLLLAKASGNPVLSIMLESVFELLVEKTLDSVDLSLERHFLDVHKKIFQILVKKNPAKVEKLIRKDILDVREKIKEYHIAKV